MRRQRPLQYDDAMLVRMRGEDKAQLTEVAQHEGRTASDLARAIIRSWLGTQAGQQQPSPGQSTAAAA